MTYRKAWPLLAAVFGATMGGMGTSPGVFAWSGDSWASITRAEIQSNAVAMIDVQWTPKNTMKNWEWGSTYYTFAKGRTFKGVAYCQNNPQENKSEFVSAVAATAGGTTYLGNDCSGFSSIAWRLPQRFTTVTFESDAAADGGYVSCLGDIGASQAASLRLGDALVKSGDHIVLFKEYTTSGIKTMEQTPDLAQYKERSWVFLNQYRPIRRNNINEDLAPFTCPTPKLVSTVVLGQRKYFTGTVRDDKGLKLVTMKVSGPKGNDLTAFSEGLSGLKKDLSGYYFDSTNSTYGGKKGSYTVALWFKDTSGQTMSHTFSVKVQ